MKATRVTFVLVVVLGLYSVDADDDTCRSYLPSTTSLEDGNCDSLSPYIKCLIKESGLANPATTDDKILKLLKIGFDMYFNQIGVTCNFDVQSMVQQIQNENPHGVKPSTEIPADYNSATSDVGCLGVLVNHREVSCSEVTSYFKCSLHVMNLAKLTSSEIDQAIPLLQDRFNNIFSQLNLKCTVNAKSMLHDILNNGGGWSVHGYHPFYFVTFIALATLSNIVLS